MVKTAPVSTTAVRMWVGLGQHEDSTVDLGEISSTAVPGTLAVGRYDFAIRPEYRVGELSDCDTLNRANKYKA